MAAWSVGGGVGVGWSAWVGGVPGGGLECPGSGGQLDLLAKEQVCSLLPESYDLWVINCGPDCSQEKDLSASARSSSEGFSVSLGHAPSFQKPEQLSLMRALRDESLMRLPGGSK